MNKALSKIFFLAIPAILLVFAFLYIFLIIQPELIFHLVQPSFIVNPDFFSTFLKYPGGPAELLANLVLQSFYFKLAGSAVLFAFAFLIGWLTYLLIESCIKSELNRIWAFIPFFVSIALTNNYNFPFSVVVSIVFMLLNLLILSKFGKGIIGSILIYTVGAIAVYWFAGSGYLLLFSLTGLFISSPLKRRAKAAYKLYISIFAYLFPLFASNYLFAVSLKYQYFGFYAPKAWFMQFEPSAIFVFYLGSIPVLLAAANGIAVLKRRKTNGNPKPGTVVQTSLAFFFIFAFASFYHISTFNSDAKKIVEADYYCYLGNAEKTAKAATSLKEYNFAANLNFNLVMSKSGSLTENFFGFLQIKGTEALHPDIDFASELSFIASDFYYNLGFISEARHWAYESLVFYPYSPRGLQNLVKIHLITGEYKAAERTLNILSKGLLSKKFVSDYSSFITDTALIATNRELMEKRSFIPAEGELSPLINRRLEQLLEASSNNKTAFEYLALYCLLDAQLENFLKLYPDAAKYFDKPVAVYEEALLMYAGRTGQPLSADIKISNETVSRYNSFIQKLKQYNDNTRLARNSMYSEYGKTYLYYLQFVYPNILEPEIVTDEDAYPAI